MHVFASIQLKEFKVDRSANEHKVRCVATVAAPIADSNEYTSSRTVEKTINVQC